ncbi:FliM/FliN family flagellar motor C-terminal domain-containing protein [Sulfitobacter aestuarii]|uniref:FliM/FliN family flagellar motor C-terminal domain-containing protein n=1 Tax=Sulfitobacter aestuarii TaxID=2161676 RepID=A0ABW5U1Z0_9RHOB
MTEVDQNSVMRRKARAGQAEAQIRGMSLAKALRLSLAKSAEALLGVAMAAIGITSEARRGEDFGDLFEAADLMLLLDGPEGRRGAALLAPALVGGLIQQQCMGKVLEAEKDAPRPMTATDAAICAPLLDRLFETAAELLSDAPEAALLDGLRFGAHVGDARLLQLALEAPEYRLVRITVDLAAGQRQGVLSLLLPLTPPAAAPGSAPAEAETAGAAAPGPVLGEVAMGLRAELDIALTRLSLPLQQISALKPGDVLSLGSARFDAVEVLTITGKQLATGRLGQVGGQRALRLTPAAAKDTGPQRRREDRGALQQEEPDRLGAAPEMETAGVAPPPPSPEPAAQPEMPDMSDLPEMLPVPEMEDPAELARLRAQAETPERLQA